MTEGRYRAFISYSHADDRWAAWLHRSLESYKPPKKLVGTKTAYGYVPARLGSVFRDREELPSATDLGAVINEALLGSACQVVVCSPAAARSKWVNEEIKAFKRLGREDRIFCLIIDGEPNASDIPGREDEECFPAALRYRLGADGELSGERTEPIAADARPNKDGRLNARLKLISGMLGVGFDALAQREMHRRNRRIMAIATASIAGMIVTTGLAVLALFARAEAETQRLVAEREAETATRTTNVFVDIVSDVDTRDGSGRDVTVLATLDQGLERIREDLAGEPAIQSRLMEAIGSVYTSLGEFDVATSLLRDALAMKQDLYGNDHLEVASVLENLADVLKDTAAYSESAELYRRALKIRTAEQNENHPDRASVMTGLADLLGELGEFDEAEQLLQRALSIHRDAFGSESREVANDLERLAFNHYSLGDLADAAALYRQVVALQRRLHEGPDLYVADALNNLALVLTEIGDYEESERLLREALVMQRVRLGGEHPELAIGLNNLALVLFDQGKYEEAETTYNEVLTVQRKLLGESHPDVGMTMNNLAFLLYEKGDVEDALSMSRQVLNLFRQAFGDEHPDVWVAMANLGAWLTEFGEYAEAERYLSDALEMRETGLGSSHPDVADSMTLLADLYLLTDRFAEAYAFATDARERAAAALSPGHWRAAYAMSAQGAALSELGRFAEAEPLLLESFEILSNDRGAFPIVIENAQQRLVGMYQASGRPALARQYQILP